MATMKDPKPKEAQRFTASVTAHPTTDRPKKRGFATKRDAETFAATVEVAKLRGEYVDSRRCPQDLDPRTRLAQAPKGHLKPSGYAVMETTWRVRVKPRWGHVALGDIRPTAVRRGWPNSARAPRIPRPVGAAAVQARDHVLSRSWPMPWSTTSSPKNPAAGLAAQDITQGARVPDHHQVERLAGCCGGVRASGADAAYTGLRWGEAIGLRVGSGSAAQACPHPRERRAVRWQHPRRHAQGPQAAVRAATGVPGAAAGTPV